MKVKPVHKVLVLLFFAMLCTGACAQIHKPVKWRFSAVPQQGAEVSLVFTALMEEGWHIYSQFLGEDGPLPTSFTFAAGHDYSRVEAVKEESTPVKTYDETFMMDIIWFEKEAVFTQKVKVHAPVTTIKGKIEFMACTDEMCLPPDEVPFSIDVRGESTVHPPSPPKADSAGKRSTVDSPKSTEVKKKFEAKSKSSVEGTVRRAFAGVEKSSAEPQLAGNAGDEKRTEASVSTTPAGQEQPSTVAQADTAGVSVQEAGAALPPRQAGSMAGTSLWNIFIGGLLGGFAAIIMPCIFPMLPFTISYFTRRTQSRRKAVAISIGYGLSIIILYVGLGLGITVLFGSGALNALSTSGIFNFFFFLLLLVFAMSLLGAFEITLPSAWVNKADAQAEKGGLGGVFFMAATLALVSFSCTGPIIGTLLVQAAAMGNYLGPAIGMLGFAIALALPFMLFAMFPSWLSALPRSGGWLNSVKVVLGFLELALALKFLSNVDLAYHWEWFDREVFLVLWIIIFALLGLYLLGKLRLPHDSEATHISPARLFMAIISLAFTLYMVPGLWGAPLKVIAAFLPPQQTQDFDLYSNSLEGRNFITPVKNQHRKYGDIFRAPYSLDAFFDYSEGMAYARQVNKPVMIDFTGHACVNCRKMETVIWPDAGVLTRLRNDFVLIQLYVDDRTPLPAPLISEWSGKELHTLGSQWSDLEASVFNTNAQPYYVLLDGTGRQLADARGADYDAASFTKFLDEGLDEFKGNSNSR